MARYRIESGSIAKRMASTGAGLEGIVATTSNICYIDGEHGILSYFGYNIHTLAENATFEEVIYLLWNGRLPNRSELEDLKLALVADRALPSGIIEFLRGVPPNAVPMDVLRTAVSMLSLYDPLAREMSAEGNKRKALKLMARVATIVTAFNSLRNGKPLIPGEPTLGYAANFLYTLTGKQPDDVMEKVFDVALILHADHELNASTFAARVTAATLSDIYSAVTSAIGALKGPLHGGANEGVIQMLLATKSPDDAAEKVRTDLENKLKVSGFGHRVYRVLDPRAIHLKKMSEEVGKRTGHAELYEKSSRVEQTVREVKNLNANVDFYSASTYYSLGIPIDLFTPVFAVSRMSGWTAHILEQYRNNRLIRPRADYTGLPDGQPWIALHDRPSSHDHHPAD
jgi:citrate synthase